MRRRLKKLVFFGRLTKNAYMLNLIKNHRISPCVLLPTLLLVSCANQKSNIDWIGYKLIPGLEYEDDSAEGATDSPTQAAGLSEGLGRARDRQLVPGLTETRERLADVSATSNGVQIGTLFISKEELDKAAKEAGIGDADYPYYSTTNACGPDGWMNKLIPDKSHLVEGADWTNACNQHDRDYMTLGMDRGKADLRMRDHMKDAMEDYLKETVTITTKRAVKRIVTERVPRQIPKLVTVRRCIRIPDRRRPLRFIEQWVEETREEFETIYEDVQKEIEELVDDVKTAKRAATLSPEQVELMRREIDTYYGFLVGAGWKFFRGSQAKQAAYLEWLNGYLEKRAGEVLPAS